jgi:hypothetical protein
MDDRKAILLLFTNKILSLGDFTPAGVEKAFASFISLLEEKSIRPPPKTVDSKEYVSTTLQDAIALAKKPIEIPFFINQYGNKECTVISGLILRDDANGVYAEGLQDGANIVPLTMREVTACKGNGFRYNGSNTTGSAQFTSDSNRI